MKTIFILSLMLSSAVAMACGSSDKAASTETDSEETTKQEVVSN